MTLHVQRCALGQAGKLDVLSHSVAHCGAVTNKAGNRLRDTTYSACCGCERKASRPGAHHQMQQCGAATCDRSTRRSSSCPGSVTGTEVLITSVRRYTDCGGFSWWKARISVPLRLYSDNTPLQCMLLHRKQRTHTAHTAHTAQYMLHANRRGSPDLAPHTKPSHTFLPVVARQEQMVAVEVVRGAGSHIVHWSSRHPSRHLLLRLPTHTRAAQR